MISKSNTSLKSYRVDGGVGGRREKVKERDPQNMTLYNVWALWTLSGEVNYVIPWN